MSAVRLVVRDRLASHGWQNFMSGFAGRPNPTLFLDPEAPAEVEAVLQDLVDQGLVIERGRLTLQLE